MVDLKKITDNITLIDGLAIFFIVLYHELGGKNTIDAIVLTNYLGIFGLCLFTFTSGFKLHLNHSNELENPTFLRKYMEKRFVRLYKPYVGYTILTFIPLYISIYMADVYFDLKLEAIDLFYSRLNVDSLIKIIKGTNFIAGHLWYLVALLIITLITFIAIYVGKLRSIYLLFFLLALHNLFFGTNYGIVSKIINYMPIFLFGIIFSQKQMYEKQNKITTLLSALFVVSLICPMFKDFNLMSAKVIVFGLTLPCFVYRSLSFITAEKKATKLIMFFGYNSFYIYLFHEPVILPAIDRLLMTYYHLDYLILPYLIAVISIIVSVYMYKICKRLSINKLFE